MSDAASHKHEAVQSFALWRRAAICVAGPLALCAFIALPAFGGDFELQLGTLIAVNALTVIGLDIVAGRGGLLHAGFGIFFGIGAYTVIVVADRWPSPTILAVAAGCVAAAIASAALGVLLARSSTLLFAVLTLSAATAASSVVSNIAWLGGNAGLAAPTRNLFGLGEIRAPEPLPVARAYNRDSCSVLPTFPIHCHRKGHRSVAAGPEYGAGVGGEYGSAENQTVDLCGLYRRSRRRVLRGPAGIRFG